MSDRNNYSCMARNEATDYGHGYEIAEDGTYVRVKGKFKKSLSESFIIAGSELQNMANFCSDTKQNKFLDLF